MQVFAQEKVDKISHFILSNVNYIKSQRLRALADFLKISQVELANLTGIDRSLINKMWKDKQDLSKGTIDKLIKWQPNINIVWLLTGEGEMLKPQKIDEKEPEEDEPLEADVLARFSSNLRALMAYHGTDATGLSPLIDLSPEVITQILEQQRGPSLATLLRLRQLWGIPLDALLFQDLSDPENMQNNLMDGGLSAEKLEAIEKALAELRDKMEKMERENEKREREMEEVRKRVGEK